jgi:hypothetical protein
MIGFELGKNMSDCPDHWYNFITELQHQMDYYRDVSVTKINKVLKIYGGRYRFTGSRKNPTIEFENEQGYVMYLLRWS